MDQRLLDILNDLGLHDSQCNKLIFGDAMPEESKPSEKEFFELLKGLMMEVSTRHLEPSCGRAFLQLYPCFLLF